MSKPGPKPRHVDDKLKLKKLGLMPKTWTALGTWARANKMSVQAAIRLAVERLLSSKH
jgi:hypothetical protein